MPLGIFSAGKEGDGKQDIGQHLFLFLQQSRREGSEPLTTDKDDVGDSAGADSSFYTEEAEEERGELPLDGEREEGEEPEQPSQGGKDEEHRSQEREESQPLLSNEGHAQGEQDLPSEGDQEVPVVAAPGSGDLAQQQGRRHSSPHQRQQQQQQQQQRMNIEVIVIRVGGDTASTVSSFWLLVVVIIVLHWPLRSSAIMFLVAGWVK